MKKNYYISLEEAFHELNHLNESKEDKERFLNWAGQDLADKFYKLKDRLIGQEKDIYFWMKKIPEELKDKLDDLDSTLSKTQLAKQKDKEVAKGAEKVYEHDNVSIYKINTYEASQKYGKHTQWCISGSAEATARWGGGLAHWNNAKKDNIQFYFIMITNTNDDGKKEVKKYAIEAYPNGEYNLWNEVDDCINNRKFSSNIPTTDDFKDILEYIDKFLEKEKIVIPASLKKVPEYFLKENEVVEEIIIEDGITEIENDAFSDCSNLISVVIPNSVKSIGEGAFEDCESLTNIIIPNSVTSIGDFAFSYCSDLTDIKIPAKVTSIGVGVFENCHSLTNIVIPNSVTTIGRYAFSYCHNLTNIVISNSVTNIGKCAFQDCSKLVNIVIPNSVTTIDQYAFQGCSNLIINCEAESKPAGWDDNWNPDNRPVNWNYKDKYNK